MAERTCRHHNDLNKTSLLEGQALLKNILSISIVMGKTDFFFSSNNFNVNIADFNDLLRCWLPCVGEKSISSWLLIGVMTIYIAMDWISANKTSQCEIKVSSVEITRSENKQRLGVTTAAALPLPLLPPQNSSEWSDPSQTASSAHLPTSS